jgi:hypothetical protein
MWRLFSVLVCVLVSVSSQGNYANCKVSVVGAGWGGAYFAYRLAKTNTVPASKICIFEQSDRIGGRVYDYTNPLWEDLVVDLGAYRYSTSQQIAKGIAESILDKDVTCYNGAPCDETTGFRVYEDQYGNNAGYATGIRGLLQKVDNMGGRDVFMNHKLVNIRNNNDDDYPIKLVFKKGNVTVNVETKKVFLNMHSSAINQLRTPGNLLYTATTNYSLAALKAPYDIPAFKNFLWYEDAWWLTKLNFTTGGMYDFSVFPPIEDLRYADAPVKCYKLISGQRHYFDHPVAGGANGSKCYGALLGSYVSFDDDTYKWYLNWTTQAERNNGQVAVFIKTNDGSGRNAFINTLHQNIMAAHASFFAAAGINPADIAPPTSTVTGYWNASYNPFTPSFFINLHDVQSDKDSPDSALSLNTLAMKPAQNWDIFVGSEAYGISFGWAEGSLIMTERVLAAFFDLDRPSYIDTTYWNQNVLPYLPFVASCNADSDCKSTNNCVVGQCRHHKCEWVTRTNQPCNQDALCNSSQTICSYTAMCYGPTLDCSPDICLAGDCVPNAAPATPACHYFNAFGSFNLWWEFTGTNNDTINIAFSLFGNSYTAFGIGTDMIGADIWMGWIGHDGQGYVQDYYSTQFGAPSLDTDIGGTNDLKNIFISSAGFGEPTKIWFSRKVNTGDSKDKPFVQGPMNFIYAFGEEGIPGQLQYHGANRNHITVDLSTCPP